MALIAPSILGCATSEKVATHILLLRTVHNVRPAPPAGRTCLSYGRRLKPTRIEDGELVYRITDRYLGRTVWTEFYVGHFGSKASVYGFDMLFPLAT